MRLLYKASIAIIVVAIIFASLNQAVYNAYVVGSFSEMEHDDMLGHIASASYVFNTRVATLQSLATDWGVWDATYAYAEDLNPAFIAENVLGNVFSNLDVNFLLIYDRSLNMLYGAAYDLEAGSFVPLPGDLLPGLGSFPASCLDVDAPASGVASINGSYAIFASHPILTSSAEGPSRGVFVFGRYVDEPLLGAISDQLQLPVGAYNSSAGAPFDLGAMEIDENGCGIMPMNESAIVAATLFPSANGNDSMVLAITSPRHLLAKGLEVSAFFTRSNILLTAVFVVLVFILADRLIVVRIGRLDSMVEKVALEGKMDTTIRLSGDDELSKLASNIDKMASALEQSKDDLKKYTERLERTVEERTAQLREKERLAAIGETATMVGHDLRNPLQSMINTIYLLKDRLNDVKRADLHDDVVRSLETLERNALYMENIVSNLNDYARPIALSPSITDVPMLVKDALSSINIPPNIAVRTDLEPLSAELDGFAMRRVLTNLITNAVQAMPRGGQLGVSARRSGDMLRIEVEDSGVGISEDDQQNIFKPFFTKKPKGMGLGLPVIKRFVELHGGTISVKSEMGKGTTMIVTLPLQQHPTRSDPS